MFGRRKSSPKPPPPPCPECGKPTNLGGRFCRACGWDADHAGGPDAHLDGVFVPEAMDDEAYGEFLEEEGLPSARPRDLRRRIFVGSILLALLAAFLWTLIPRFW
jgi:hypothetical protein